jgi:hypothetical protein
MKTPYIFGIALVLIVLVFALVAAANFEHPTVSAKNLSAASLSMKVATPTPSVGDRSEVGSTDGIVIMGFLLVIVVTVPVLFHIKKK